jgi:predicted house-cleaning NTP pyrophosphatase (Maf/HAM1 superfamily)
MLVLLSSSMERQEVLRSIGIPFLAFDPVKDLDRFPQTLRKAAGPPGAHDEWSSKLNDIWEFRLTEDRFILGEEAEDIYPDLRKEREKLCLATAKALLATDVTGLPDRCRESLIRAAVWSQLIWSDPGQVLWDSFLLTVQTFLQQNATDSWVFVSDLPEGVLAPENLAQDKQYRIASYIILLCQGEKIFDGLVEGKPFHFSDSIFNASETVQAYNDREMGKDRLAGLDIRCCGDFLIKDFSDKEPEERHAMAGMPWHDICELLKGSRYSKDFKQLCNALEKRKNG